MGKDQVLGLVRHVLTFVGGLLITKGVIDSAASTEIIGAIVTLVGSVWSVASKKQSTPAA